MLIVKDKGNQHGYLGFFMMVNVYKITIHLQRYVILFIYLSFFSFSYREEKEINLYKSNVNTLKIENNQTPDNDITKFIDPILMHRTNQIVNS